MTIEELHYHQFQVFFRRTLPDDEGISFLIEAAELCRAHDPDFAAMLLVLAHSFDAIRHYLDRGVVNEPCN